MIIFQLSTRQIMSYHIEFLIDHHIVMTALDKPIAVLKLILLKNNLKLKNHLKLRKKAANICH